MMLIKLKKILFIIYLNLPGTRELFQLIKKFHIPRYRVRKYLRFKGVYRLVIEGQSSLKMMSYGNTIENELFWLGMAGWEANSTTLWRRLSVRSQVIFDVGANTGLYALISSVTNPDAAVYAFEPVDLIFERLKKNVHLNKVNINLSKIALAEKDGEGKIFVADTISGTYDQASLNEMPQVKRTNSFSISKRKLSTFILEHNIDRIDLMKIDVETFEPEVLQGMGPYLKKFAPTILIEILNQDVAQKVQALINDVGYQYYMIDEKKGYIPKDNLSPGRRGNNFLLLNRERHSITE